MPVRDRVRRFLQKPGTADLTRFRRLLPAIGAREEALRQVPDGELAARAAKASADDDMAEFAAVAREAARPRRTTEGKRNAHSPPLSTYSGPGGLRQDPGHAA